MIFPIDLLNSSYPLTVPGSTIITPDLASYTPPQYYKETLDTEVTITFETRVAIVFEKFSLFYVGWDWLEVYDGVSSNSDLIKTLDGDDIPSPITSTGTSLTLVFHSNNRTTKTFRIKTYPYQGTFKYTEIKNLRL